MRLNADKARLTAAGGNYNKVNGTLVDKQISDLLKVPIDKAASVFAPQGPTGQQTTAAGATGFEAAADPLTPLLQKRVASTLRIPYAPKPVPATPPINTQ